MVFFDSLMIDRDALAPMRYCQSQYPTHRVQRLLVQDSTVLEPVFQHSASTTAHSPSSAFTTLAILSLHSCQHVSLGRVVLGATDLLLDL